MKYTEEDISGLIFESGYNHYRCLSLEDGEVLMEYVYKNPGYTFVNTIETTLRNLNNGNWVVVRKETLNQYAYEIY